MVQSGKSYIKDSAHFLEIIKTLGFIPDNTILLTADLVGFYPSIPYEAGFIALHETLDKRIRKRYLLTT